jgi:hypothetical protein
MHNGSCTISLDFLVGRTFTVLDVQYFSIVVFYNEDLETVILHEITIYPLLVCQKYVRLENNTKSWKIDFFGKVVLDLFLLLLFCFSCILYSTSPFSFENFDPCNFSQGAEKVVFFQVFYAAKNL